MLYPRARVLRIIASFLVIVWAAFTGKAMAASEPAPADELAIAAILNSNLPATPLPFISSAMTSLTPPAPKRLFGIIPNHRADQYQADYQPLNRSEKFEIARQDSFDWPNYFLLVGYAMQSEMASGNGSHTSKLAGFGQFYSRSVADQIIGSYVTEAILPSLFHEDPRYFRLGTGSLWFRAFHAASMILVARRDNGRKSFAFSETLGNAGVVAISSLYYTNDQSAKDAAQRFGMTLGNDVISNLLTEFWPDIKRRLPSLRRR